MECLYIDADNISYKSMDIIDNKINLNKICVKKYLVIGVKQN